jgi:hypothetical protein
VKNLLEEQKLYHPKIMTTTQACLRKREASHQPHTANHQERSLKLSAYLSPNAKEVLESQDQHQQQQ